MATRNVGTFSLDVQRFAEAAKERVQQFQRDFLRALADDLVSDTPVITGMLRGSWGANIGATMIATHAAKPEPGGGTRGSPSPLTVARLGSMTDLAPVGEIITYYNVAPYATAVEYGTENFAGRAYVRGTMARAPAIAEQILTRYEQ